MKKIGNNQEKNSAFLCVFLTAISAFTLASIIPSAHAEDSVVTTTAITISESCSMTGTINTPHNATIINGTYSGASYPNGIGQTTLKAFCNDSAGFAIYAIGYTGNEYGNTKLHSSTLGSTYDINTGIYNSDSASSSTWSMKLTSVSGTYAPTIADGTNGLENFTTWHVVPSTYTKVAYRTSGTDTDNSGSGIGSSLTTTYDAYVSATQPAGTYVGQVKYTLVHPTTAPTPEIPMDPLDPTLCPTNSICYAPNSIIIEGSMDSISSTKITSSPTAGVQSVTANSTATLIAPNYSREGYGFAGWSTDFEATSNSTIYGPNETVSTNPNDTDGLNVATTDGGAILYPVWIASKGNLQGWTGCSSLTTAPTNTRATLASITALKDTRDNNIYAVARLADGKCWMVENLRLDNTATITTANTHSPLNTNGNVTLIIDYANSTIANHLASSSDVWCNSGNAACINQTMLNTNNTNIGGKNSSNIDLIPSHNTNTNTAQWYSYGNYYNWYSATAGNGTYDFATRDNSATGDLCPAGWHLPEGGIAHAEGDTSGVNVTGSPTTYRDFYNLGYSLMGTVAYESQVFSNFSYYDNTTTNATGDNATKAFRKFPNNFIFSGSIDGGSSASGRNSTGLYWSSTVNTNSFTYVLLFHNKELWPATIAFDKYDGYSVRCIAQ